MAPSIVVTSEPISPGELSRLVALYFKDMVKLAVDLERGVIAVGGELHADAEALLIEDGSRQEDVWGGNYYPGRGEEGCIEFTSLINIRPSRGNESMEIESPDLRARFHSMVFELVGRGEALP